MRNEVTLTIFTPTFNRGKDLLNCYRSIVKQEPFLLEKCEWIIIDDGSTDETNDIISTFSNKKLRIKTVYQKNSGKQASWNNAINMANGKFFLGLDSDDELNFNALQLIFRDLNVLNDDSTSIGIRYLARKSKNNGRLSLGKCLGGNLSKHSWFDELSQGALGERIDVFKLSLLRKFLFPQPKGVKYIPEIWFFCNVSSQGFEFFYSNDVVRIINDDSNENRLSVSGFKDNPLGFYISKHEVLKSIPSKIFIKKPVFYLKNIYVYCKCLSILQKKSDTDIGKINFIISNILLSIIKL